MTPEVIIKSQLENTRENDDYAVGVYPLLTDGTVFFVVIDFDEGDYMKDASAVVKRARLAGFAMAIERSRSGAGIHLWLFFNEPVAAKTARRLAFSFLEQAAEGGEIKTELASYDRIFPTQDSLNAKGLGNLILMPLIRSAAMRNPKCTVFLDDEYNYYKDQFEYLSALPRHSNSEVNSYLASLKSHDEMSFSLDSMAIDLKRSIPKIDKNDFKGTVIVYLSSGVTIAKSILTPKAYYFFYRLSSYSNPEYFKAKARYDGYVPRAIPSIISLMEESSTAILLPRGLESLVLEIFRNSSIPHHIENHRIGHDDLSVVFKGKLRNEQYIVFERLASVSSGMLLAGTSFGKTIVAIALIAYRKERTLILVHKADLAEQWKEKLRIFLNISNDIPKRAHKRKNREPFGVLTGNKDTLTGLVDIAMIQSISSKLERKKLSEDILSKYGMVIVDEAHHIAADTFSAVIKELSPKYLFGLTATDRRKDGKDKTVYAIFGQIIKGNNASELAYARGMAQYVIPHFFESRFKFNNRKWNDLIDMIIKDEERNEIIVKDIEKAKADGRHILVASSRIEHVEKLAELLIIKGIKVIKVYGKINKREEFKESDETKLDNPVTIATSQFISEGSDYPYLDTLFLVTPISWKGNIQQIAGRIGRFCENKKNTVIHDYIDYEVPVLLNSYRTRLRVYSSIGYILKGHDEIPVKEYVFYIQNYFSEMSESLRKARKSIIISVPLIIPTKNTIAFFEILRTTDVPVLIYRYTPEIEKYKKVEDTNQRLLSQIKNLSIREKKSNSMIYLAIDYSELWYGNLNFLAAGESDRGASIIHIFDERVVNSVIAKDSDSLF